MNQPILHQATANQLTAARKNFPHAILLAGPTGIGLLTVAKSLAESIATNILIVEPDEKNTISIDVVRNLYTNTRSKQTNQQIVIIDDVDTMSFAAQNAFLKLLEEPTSHTSFILTSHATDSLLSTVRSRAQIMNVQAIASKQSEQLLDTLGITNAKQRQQLAFIATGLPAELTRLAGSPEYFSQQAELARSARKFLSSKSYDRLILAYQFGNNRDQAIQLLDHIMRILKYSLQDTAGRSLTLQLDQVLKTAELIQNNGHVRTQLLKLALSL